LRMPYSAATKRTGIIRNFAVVRFIEALFASARNLAAQPTPLAQRTKSAEHRAKFTKTV
jgi:hypothetical protein